MYLIGLLIAVALIFGVVASVILTTYETKVAVTEERKKTEETLEIMRVEKAIKTAEFERLQLEMTYINRESYDIYMAELDKMISGYTVFSVDEVFGVQFRDRKAIDVDIQADDIFKVVGDVGESIINDLQDTPMKIFLYHYFGRETIQVYIKNKSMAMAINYCKEKKKEIQHEMAYY